jgi:hypothetical protein
MTETLPAATNAATAASDLGNRVRAGANLPAKWTDQRIAAALRFLPQQYRDPANAIGFLILAERYDLDPFARELWGWEQDGRLTIMTSRDGLTKKLRRDPKVLGYDAQIVFSGDTFTATKNEAGKVIIQHATHPFAQDAHVVGAYCVVRGAEGAPDLLVTRKMTDYAHLARKSNWVNYPQDMLLTRVISAAARLVVDLGGVYTDADMAMVEAADIGVAVAQDATDQALDELEAQLVDAVVPQVVTTGQAGVAAGVHVAQPVGEQPGTPSRPYGAEHSPQGSDYITREPAEMPPSYVCPHCGEGFDSPQAKGGHTRKGCPALADPEHLRHDGSGRGGCG